MKFLHEIRGTLSYEKTEMRMRYYGNKRAKKGFSLIEMIIAMGILVIMSVAISGAFSSGILSYGASRGLQRSVESAQYAMNTLEKFLRTSTVLSSSSSAIEFYDYSSRRCFQYRIHAGSHALQARGFDNPNPTSPVTCPSGSFTTAFAPVTTGYVTGSISAVASTSSPKKMGRVTINLSVKESAASALEARIQATASLRDYTNVGF